MSISRRILQMAGSIRMTGIILLLAYVLPVAGTADAPVLCFGMDGHRQVESSVSCMSCGALSVSSGNEESRVLAAGPLAGDSCGLCQDYSFSGTHIVSRLSVPAPSSRLDLKHVALQSLSGMIGYLSGTSADSFRFGTPEPADPIARHTRPVVLLI